MYIYPRLYYNITKNAYIFKHRKGKIISWRIQKQKGFCELALLTISYLTDLCFQ